MLLEPAADLTRRMEPAELPEWMDEPCTYEDFRACLRDLAQLNRLTRAARPTLEFLAKIAAPSHGPLRIVDVGSGGGDMLRAIERWARQRSVDVHLAGIDLNPYAARAAREFTPPGSKIEWLTGDAFSYTAPVDVVISSLFTHHLSTDEAIAYLAWSERTARRAWFVNDLCREPTPFRWFGLLARIMRWHRFVRHDGPVSFRRAFREPDWQRIAASAGIPADAVQMQRQPPGRLCVGRIK